MNNKTIFILTFLLIITFFLGCQEAKYPSGRDTFDSFGDGRFQILRFGHSYLTLFDFETQSEIVQRVKDYSKKDDFVYLLADNGVYTVLNLITGKYQYYKSPIDAPDDYRVYLSKLRESWRIKLWKKF